MNAHKAAVKTAKARRVKIRDERYWIKFAIRSAVCQGKDCISKNIYYTETFDWLKENSFKFTKHPDFEHLYKISWEGC